MLIFDTNFLIEFLKGDKSTKKKLESYNEPIATTAINAFELLYGYHLVKDSLVTETARGLLKTMSTLPLDLAASEIASRLAADLARKGKMLEHMDILTAAIALEHGATLVTKNTRHFSRIQKLKIESW